MSFRRIVFVLVATLFSCGTPAPEPDGSVVDAGVSDGGAPDAGEDGGVADAGLPDAGPTDAGDLWEAVRQELRNSADGGDAGAVAMSLSVWDDAGLRFTYSVNGFSPDQRVPLASASKLISATTILEAVNRGALTLQSTTGQVLGWTGPKGNITLEHLLSFTSGLRPENACTFDITITLEACVALIEQQPLRGPPATTFEYGSTHLAVAGRMVEVTTGKSWNTFFDEVLRVPLGLPSEVTYWASATRDLGRLNPLLAAGLRASMNEYAKLLRLIYFQGQTPELTYATPALFAAQAREPFPNVSIDASPAAAAGFPFRYGYGAWLECSTPAMGCSSFSSAGSFGFTPWVERSEGYYAILGMQLDPGSGINYAVPVEQRLQPLIRAALRR